MKHLNTFLRGLEIVSVFLFCTGLLFLLIYCLCLISPYLFIIVFICFILYVVGSAFEEK